MMGNFSPFVLGYQISVQINLKNLLSDSDFLGDHDAASV